MGDLTANLSRHEFACKCGCGFDGADYELVTILQDLVDCCSARYGDCFIVITGPNRCADHNLMEGGVANSEHTRAKAADFKIFIRDNEQVDPDEVADILDTWYPSSKGIGRYHNRTHFDVRQYPARWDNR